ncbi:MAG: RHS repeat-associated core domain-containing protein [Armatimonadota bacterium]|nr:RHS repeat-associated core domain-containing protein [Armatimonadota bacterium]
MGQRNARNRRDQPTLPLRRPVGLLHPLPRAVDESLLHQLGVRYYAPEIGRFTQRDPLLSAGSAYCYAENLATRLADPTGYRGEWLYGDGRICVDSSCYGHDAWLGGIKNIPALGGPNAGRQQRLPHAPKPRPCQNYVWNCALTDAIYVPPNISFDLDGVPQRPDSKHTVLKIRAGWTCLFTCDPKAHGNKLKLKCRNTSRLRQPPWLRFRAIWYS